MHVAIIGAGIGGLTLALALKEARISCTVYEAVPGIKPLGVGLNLLPHAMRELERLGLGQALGRCGIETCELRFYTAHGQLVDREPRGRFAGYEWPQVSIHRADLQQVLLQHVQDRLGSQAVVLGHRCTGARNEKHVAIATFVDTAGRPLQEVRADVVVGCDGVHSAVRKMLHPTDSRLHYEPSTQWRGVTRWRPFLSGASMVYVGTKETGKLVCYPIRNSIDEAGCQLINWVVEVQRPSSGGERDWERSGRVEDFVERFANWKFDWLDVAGLLRSADAIFEYPMVDQEPLTSWGLERITLLGDAAHAMTPRGSNGAAQAIIDAAVLAQMLKEHKDARDALVKYEELRLPATSAVVLANRTQSPDAILAVVQERTGGRPFERLDEIISSAELAQWQERYKRVAGFHPDSMRGVK